MYIHMYMKKHIYILINNSIAVLTKNNIIIGLKINKFRAHFFVI